MPLPPPEDFSDRENSPPVIVSSNHAKPIRANGGAPDEAAKIPARAGRGERAGDPDSALAMFENFEREERENTDTRKSEKGTSLRPRERDTGALESADDASLRDFYGQLVTLLTQENAPRAKPLKSRTGFKDVLRRRFWPALIIFLLSLGALATFLRPKEQLFVASTELLLPAHDVSSNRDVVASPEETYDAAAQIAIIESEPIVREALRRVPPAMRAKGFGNPHADSAPLSVTSAGSDQLVSIAVSSLDPDASYLTVEAMVAAYKDYSRNRFNSNVKENLGRTSKLANSNTRQLLDAQNQMRRLKERYGVLDYNSAQSSATTSIASLQTQLDAAKSDAQTAVSTDVTLQNLQDKAGAAKTARDDLNREFFSDAPRVRVAQAALDAANQQVAARRAQVESNARARVDALQGSLNRARSGAKILPAVEQKMGQLNARIAGLQSASTVANTQLSQLQFSAQRQAPIAKTLQSTSVGSSATAARARAFAVSLVGALALALLTAFLLDRLDHSVRTAPDPENLFGAPILGALPASNESRTFYLAPTNANKGNVRARTQSIEACTHAQNNILAAATASGARSILLTSALPGEGKSGCASNLAAAMAYGGREVLLIDVDFWHPSQHTNFGLPLEPGYAQVLRDDLPLSEAIRPTSVANLFLLTTGQDASQPGDIAELLDSRGHRRNMEMLKKYFDIVVLDAPPTMTVADAQLLSGLADTVVLVSAEKTRRDEVQRARSMLRLAGSHILGVIVNSVRPGEVEAWNLNFSAEEPFADYAQHRRSRNQ